MTTDPPIVRPATAGDAEALTRLRGLMFDAMGVTTGPDTVPWRPATVRWFAERADAGDGTFAAFVADDPELGVVCGAVGLCHVIAPSPTNPTGVRGEVFNVSTDPRRRRRGLARACLTRLLTWFADESGASLVTLNATSDGIGLYRSVGFTEPRYPALRLRLPAQRPTFGAPGTTAVPGAPEPAP